MKIRKLIAAVSATAIIATSCIPAFAADNLLEKIKEDGVLQVCMEPYFAPYEFIDTSKEGQEQYQGADIELAKVIAEKLDVELEIVPLEFSAVIASVVGKKYPMAISGLGYTPERAESVEMSDSYRTMDSLHGFIIRKEDADKYHSLADLAGKAIAYQNGSLQDMYTHDQIENPQGKPFDSVQQCVLCLQSGKADAVAVYAENGELFVGANDDIQMADFYFEDTKETNCIAIQKGETELLDFCNEVIAEVVEKGLYDEWWADATEYAATLGIN